MSEFFIPQIPIQTDDLPSPFKKNAAIARVRTKTMNAMTQLLTIYRQHAYPVHLTEHPEVANATSRSRIHLPRRPDTRPMLANGGRATGKVLEGFLIPNSASAVEQGGHMRRVPLSTIVFVNYTTLVAAETGTFPPQKHPLTEFTVIENPNADAEVRQALVVNGSPTPHYDHPQQEALLAALNSHLAQANQSSGLVQERALAEERMRSLPRGLPPDLPTV